MRLCYLYFKFRKLCEGFAKICINKINTLYVSSKGSDETTCIEPSLLPYMAQGSHRLIKYLNIQDCLEKSLKIKFSLKSS